VTESLLSNKLGQLRELVVRTGSSSFIPIVENMLVDIFEKNREKDLI
jgi:hypothetical protein